MALTSSAGLFREDPRGPDGRNHAKKDLEFLERSGALQLAQRGQKTLMSRRKFFIIVTSQLSCSDETHARMLRFWQQV